MHCITINVTYTLLYFLFNLFVPTEYVSKLDKQYRWLSLFCSITFMLCFYSLWMCFCIVKTISLLTFNKTITSIQTAHFPQIDVMAFNGWPHFGHLMHMSFAFILSRDSGSRVQARQQQVKQYWLRRACCLSDVVMWPTCGPRINVKYCHTRNFHAHEMIANLMNCSDSWKYTVV